MLVFLPRLNAIYIRFSLHDKLGKDHLGGSHRLLGTSITYSLKRPLLLRINKGTKSTESA
jgi:hypothetical protein